MPDNELKPWERIGLEPEESRTVRLMLGIEDTDPLPRRLVLAMACYRALVGHQFVTSGFTPQVVAMCALYAELLPLVIAERGRFRPGTPIFWKAQSMEGTYVMPGPMDLELINCHGQFYLANPKDIDTDSEFLRQAELGEALERKLADGDPLLTPTVTGVVDAADVNRGRGRPKKSASGVKLETADAGSA